MAWSAKVVDVDGTVLRTLSDVARISNLSLELNRAGTATISLPTNHDDAAYLLPGREVQILLDDTIVFWGPIVRPQAGLRETSWQCAGLLWYFDHRFMGRADRINHLTNGDFEDGETGWTFHDDVTHIIETSEVLEGTQALQLEGTAANHDTYAYQTYTHTLQSHPEGDYLTVSAWVYVVGNDYLGGAIADRGILAVHRNAGGGALFNVAAQIDDNTPVDQWIQLEVGIPTLKEGDTVEVYLYPPHGVAYFDLVTATFMESLSFGYPSGVDVATVIEGIVAYAQDRDPYDFDHGKSDLNIDVDADPTGRIITHAYQFAEHRNIGDALAEYVRRGIVDIDFVYTSTTRTLTAYSPAKGTLFGTTLELDTHLADFTWSWDGERAAGSVVVIGPGDGPDRPEGGAVDATFLDGLTLEIVESAADDVTVGELDRQAAETLAVAKNPVILEVTTLPGVGVIGNVTTGDTVPVVISHGWIDIDATYRIVRIDIDPYMDTARLTLNVT